MLKLLHVLGISCRSSFVHLNRIHIYSWACLASDWDEGNLEELSWKHCGVVTATHNPQRYFGPSSVSGNVQTQRGTDTHTSLKTPKSQHLPPVLPSCPDVPALPGTVWLSLPLLIDVTSTCMAVRSGSLENPAFHGGCWRKPSSSCTKGRGWEWGFNEVPGKKHCGCCCHSKCWGVQMKWERDKKDSVLAYEENPMQPVPSWGLSPSIGIDVLGIFQSLEKGSKWKGKRTLCFKSTNFHWIYWPAPSWWWTTPVFPQLLTASTSKTPYLCY